MTCGSPYCIYSPVETLETFIRGALGATTSFLQRLQLDPSGGKRNKPVRLQAENVVGPSVPTALNNNFSKHF